MYMLVSFVIYHDIVCYVNKNDLTAVGFEPCITCYMYVYKKVHFIVVFIIKPFSINLGKITTID